MNVIIRRINRSQVSNFGDLPSRYAARLDFTTKQGANGYLEERPVARLLAQSPNPILEYTEEPCRTLEQCDSLAGDLGPWETPCWRIFSDDNNIGVEFGHDLLPADADSSVDDDTCLPLASSVGNGRMAGMVSTFWPGSRTEPLLVCGGGQDAAFGGGEYWLPFLPSSRATKQPSGS